MDKIAQFSIIKEIGKGGFGTVYLAHDLEINEYVALKKIENYKERKHEIKGIQKFKKSREFFKKENIISIYDTIKHGDDFYYSMPIADGMAGMVCTDIKYVPKTLDLLIKEKKQEGGWFSKDEILDIVLPIAKALKAIDSCGLKHRDVKPANIVFVKNQPVLSDFGMLVDDNSAMSACGTFDYAPPEWFLNSGGDPDMWGFAMTFFTLFSGRSPSESKEAKKYPKSWTEDDLRKNKDTWDQFYKIVFRIKEGKEKNRFPSWQSLCDELSSMKSAEATSANYTRINKISIIDFIKTNISKIYKVSLMSMMGALGIVIGLKIATDLYINYVDSVRHEKIYKEQEGKIAEQAMKIEEYENFVKSTKITLPRFIEINEKFIADFKKIKEKYNDKKNEITSYASYLENSNKDLYELCRYHSDFLDNMNVELSLFNARLNSIYKIGK